MTKIELLNAIRERSEENNETNKNQFLFLSIALLGFIMLLIAKTIFPEKLELGLIALAVFSYVVVISSLFGWFIQRSGAYKDYLENKLSNHYQDENAGDPNKIFEAGYWEAWKNKSNIYTGVINAIALLPLIIILLWAIDLPVFNFFGNSYYVIMGLVTGSGFYFLVSASRIARSYLP